MIACPDLEGRVAVVTGALGRLGPLWCRTLAGAGMTVVGLDARTGDAPDCASLEVVDVTDVPGVREAAERIVATVGVPHVLVNNAGIDAPPDAAASTSLFEDISLDAFRRTVDVNLAGTFNVIQAIGSDLHTL